MSDTFGWAASYGMGAWYGFATRAEAEEWLGDRNGTVTPRCLVSGDVRAPAPALRVRNIEAARTEAAIRNARNFGTDPSWYGR